MAANEIKKMTFEQTMAELEKMITDVEEGKVSLEESIEKYERGMKLIRHGRSILEQAEKRIETISGKGDANREEGEESASEE